MANSLADQLLKAGVANQQQVRKAKKNKHKQAKQHQADAANAADKARAQQAAQAKAERDRALNEQRKIEQAQRELQAQVRQLVETHRQPRDKKADIAYNFVDADKVKRIYITEEQQRRLSLGQWVLLVWGEGYEVIPADVAEKILARDPNQVVLHNQPESPNEAEAEDPYADYQIPDDLMW